MKVSQEGKWRMWFVSKWEVALEWDNVYIMYKQAERSPVVTKLLPR